MLRLQKIAREKLVSTSETQYDHCMQMWEHVGLYRRADGMGGEIIASIKVSTTMAAESEYVPHTPEFGMFLDLLLEERIELDLQEINGEGPFEGCPMDEEVKDMRKVLCLGETE